MCVLFVVDLVTPWCFISFPLLAQNSLILLFSLAEIHKLLHTPPFQPNGNALSAFIMNLKSILFDKIWKSKFYFVGGESPDCFVIEWSGTRERACLLRMWWEQPRAGSQLSMVWRPLQRWYLILFLSFVHCARTQFNCTPIQIRILYGWKLCLPGSGKCDGELTLVYSNFTEGSVML